MKETGYRTNRKSSLFIWPCFFSILLKGYLRPCPFPRYYFLPFSLSFLLILIALQTSNPLPALAEYTPKIELTPAQKAWLAEHPDIVLGTTTEYQPMAIKRADGTHYGMLLDIYEQINQVLNTNIRIHVEDPWATVQEKASKREFDGLALGGRDPSRKVLYNPTDAILSTYFSVFGRNRDEFIIKSFSDLEGLRIGYKKAAGPTRSLLEKLSSATLKPYDSHESMTQALLSREIDVIVAWMSYDHWRKDKMQGTIDNIYIIEEYPIEMVSHIRNDWPELIPILNKVIAAIQQEELPRILNKWFVEWPQSSKAKSISLTPEEHAWLSQEHVVRVRVGDNPPWNINTPVPAGMSVDNLKWIGEKFGIKFQFIPDDKPWIDGFKDIAGEHLNYDLDPTAKRTPERLETLAMSDEYLHSPWVVFTRDDVSGVYTIDDLQGKKVAVERGYVMEKKLETELPGAELVVKGGTEEVLLAVSTKQADAYVGNLIVTSHLLARLGITNIKVACPTPYGDHSQAMATRKEWAPLISIINKGLKHIPQTEKTRIQNKYTAVRYEHGINKAEVLQWILIATGATSVVLLFFIVWNKQLGRKVDERTSQLMETESRFRATFEQAAVGVAHVSLEGKFLRINQKFCDITGYSEDEILDLSFQGITHPEDLNTDLEHVQQVIHGDIENYSMDKRYIRNDGSVVWVNLTVSLVFDRGGNPKYFVSVIKDISERKDIEQDLARSEAKYRELIDNSIVGVFNSNVNGEFLFVNEAMVEMFEFDDPEQMQAEGSLSCWVDLKHREKMLDLLNEHGSVSNYEAETITNTGRHIHVIFSVKQFGENIIGMVMDISDRKMAENKLSEAFGEIEQLQKQLQAESIYLQEEIKLEHNFENIIGQSEALKYVLHRVEQVAPQDSTVLLLGETGTGKELVARALHRLSARNNRPLVKVNCAALPGELIESELFGREKGAFTGATSTQIGRFELAHESTLFLDEIGEMPLALQAKLLRVIETGEFERLGSSRTLKSDVRIIAATNRDIEKEVLDNRFREDLLYRLKIFPITIPPLRDRIDDIPLLVKDFVQFFSRKMGKLNAVNITKKSLHALQSYSWPGNVRELKHVVESALISAHGSKLHFDIPQTADFAEGGLKSFEEMEREYILKVLKAKNWKIEGKDSAASTLVMPASTLRSRIKKLRLKRP